MVKECIRKPMLDFRLGRKEGREKTEVLSVVMDELSWKTAEKLSPLAERKRLPVQGSAVEEETEGGHPRGGGQTRSCDSFLHSHPPSFLQSLSRIPPPVQLMEESFPQLTQRHFLSVAEEEEATGAQWRNTWTVEAVPKTDANHHDYWLVVKNRTMTCLTFPSIFLEQLFVYRKKRVNVFKVST